MANSLRGRVAGALSWTTDQIEGGTYGKLQVKTRGMYLDDIQRHLGGRIPDALPRYALCVEVVEGEDPGGQEVVVGKKRSGLFVVTADSFLLARDAGWSRTLTEHFGLEGCRAEPVTCAVKGQETPGFRIVGHPSALIALDPGIGQLAGKVRIRDRIVSTFNGEEQAGPGQHDTPGGVQTALPRLVRLPTTDSDDARNPQLDAEGELAFAESESLLYRGQHRTEALRNEPVAFGNQWRTTLGPATSADVWITNRRIAVSWKDWSGDASAADLIERRRRAGFSQEEQGGMTVAGQLTVAWIGYIFVGRADSSLEFQASDRGMAVRLKLLGLEAAEAERLLRETAAAVATYRLAADETLKPDERAMLLPISRGQPTIEELDWGLGIRLPSAFTIARDPASLPTEPS